MCNEDLYKKYGLKKSVLGLISSRDLKLPNDDIPWMDKDTFDKSILLNNVTYQNFSKDIKENIFKWNENGYMQLPNFYSVKEVNEINQTIDNAIKNKTAVWRFGDRIFNAIHQFKNLKEIILKPNLTEALSFVLGKKVQLFQSLNFIHGSKQKAHSDTIHMTTYPLGYLIAVWIALEDIDEDSGPLTYYPGSHHLPYVLSKDYQHNGNFFTLDKNSYGKYEIAIANVITSNELKQEKFLAKKGDVFIWHANLLHGGSPIKNEKLTRKSMVLHFYAKDVICYHEITERPAIFNDKEAHCAHTVN